MMTLPTRIELTDGERFLLPFHKPTAEYVMQLWHEAFIADVHARWSAYERVSTANPHAAHVWELTVQCETARSDEEREALGVECEAYASEFDDAYAPFIALFEEVDTLPSEDLLAAYECLWGTP